jgi:hypothetical protein
MQNVENPHHASLLAGTVLRCLERLQIEELEQFYIFNDGLSIMVTCPPKKMTNLTRGYNFP